MRDRIKDYLLTTQSTLTCFQDVSGHDSAGDIHVRNFVERIVVGECSDMNYNNNNHSINSSNINGNLQVESLGLLASDPKDDLELFYSPTGSALKAATTLATATAAASLTNATNTEGYGCFAVHTVELSIHVYQLYVEGAVEEFDYGRDGGEEPVMMAQHWVLPCQEFEGVWESLIYEDQVQTKLLEYVYSMILFSDKNVNPNIISWNRVVLLHGPPGTGKTSLCRGLAQKLSVRLSRYKHTKLLEINSHSLFSKWFSESGKMVQKLFNEIWAMVEDPDVLVCILIDEVESLAAARKAALSGSEPSDSIRVVNALLTQIDRLKHKKNVLILTTSNITEAIDRADLKLYIGLPSKVSIYTMLKASLDELQR
ncbi:Pachytene checkpoint protein 2, partial [Podila epigama]